MRITLIVLSVLFSVSLFGQPTGKAKKVLKLMGSRFEITALATNDTIAWQAVEAGIAEISRIEKLISSWEPNSQTSEVNRNAGIKAVVVDAELFELIARAVKISKLTQGAFDISFASMDRIWKFDRMEQKLPDPTIVQEAASKINWENIVLDRANLSVFLKEKGMKIGFGAIGKGYAANRAKAIMEKIPGVKGGVVNASGDLIAWGENPQNDGWKIQIADPKDKEASLGWLSMKEGAIVTSGDYEKYFTSEGKRYAHIVDPKTGYPTVGIKSVTIICPDAELADALATSVFVLGAENGLYLVNHLNQVECLIITDQDEVITSENLQLNYQ
ncbi:MAG: FAD:protein FMN transferase [Saprospiraceae bacterium]